MSGSSGCVLDVGFGCHRRCCRVGSAYYFEGILSVHYW